MQPSRRIRHATAADIPALADLAARTFRETFETQNTPEDIASYLERWFSPIHLQREFDDPTSTFLLAFSESTGPPIGYAKLRTDKADSSVRGPRPVELERLYVDRPALGHGVGAALMKACLEQAVREGYETLWLGVWEHNQRAMTFYRRWGFEAVGTHTFLLGSDLQIDVIMERTFAAGGRSTTSRSRGT